jgi:hypothetical protein
VYEAATAIARLLDWDGSSCRQRKTRLTMAQDHPGIAWCVALACIISGCMTFQSNDARRFSTFPPPTIAPLDQMITLNLDTTYQLVGRSTSEGWRQSAADNINGWLEDIFEDTGVFIIQTDAGTADFRLVIRVRNDPKSSRLGRAVAAITLLILPAKATNSFSTDMELLDSQGNEVGQKRYRHRLTKWYQALLLFGTPFATRAAVKQQMWHEVLQDAAVWCAAEVQNARSVAQSSFARSMSGYPFSGGCRRDPSRCKSSRSGR